MHPHSASTDGVSIAIHYHHEEAPALLSRDELEQEWLKKVKEVIEEKWLVEGGGQVGIISSTKRSEGRNVVFANAGLCRRAYKCVAQNT
jgi:hypothetical protein